MDTLANFPLLEGMTEEQQKTYSDRCIWRTYNEDELIIDHLEESQDIRFVTSGTVQVIVRMLEGREIILNDHNAGEFFGELAAIDGGPRSANVTAKVRTRICIMPQAVFRDLVTEVPEIGWRMMNHLAGHVRRLSDRISEFSFLKAKHRLYAELLRMSRPRTPIAGSAVDTSGQRIISPSPKQKEIADRIASRREIVSREMRILARKAILERTKGGLVILEPDTLAAMAADGWMS